VLFMNNIHGARLNTDLLERKGSGYVGRHGKDFLLANDSWSQLLDMQYGPDGSVHIIDWYDKNQCHSPNPDVHQKTLGRIFKVSHRDDEWVRVDLREKSGAELVALQLHENDWYVRHARRILQERGADPSVHAKLREILDDNPDVTRRLRALWALHVTEGLDDDALIALLSDPDEHVRAWSIRLLAEDRDVPEAGMESFVDLAREDPSPLVRLELASALQRMPPESRWDVLAALYARSEDADDHNLPLMIWYAAEPLVPLDMDRALTMALESDLPYLLPHTVERIAAIRTPEAIRTISTHLSRINDRGTQKELLRGLNLMLSGAE
ncbi:MAG TPA: HEAT repeat domain-containing protein, partial [Rhodothermales bacterium]